MAKLLVTESAGAREFDLVDAEAHIGRELDNSLRLADPSISRHHAVVRRTPTGYEVQDLQSSNGVLLNGSRVQTSPLQDGDRITLGQIQLTFHDPQPAMGATVAVSRADLPEAPLGTMRMSAEQIAQIHGTAPVSAAPPVPVQVPVAAPVDAAPITGPQAILPPSPPPPPPSAIAPPPPPPPRAEMAPAFGQFTNPGTQGASMSANPLPSFIQPYLPSIPDDAQPTGERGDFVTRLLAILVDAVVPIAIQIMAMILAFIPFVGCIIMPLMMVMSLGYFIFLLWCTVTYGATPGKKLMKLRVVPEDNPTGRIDWGMAILRLIGSMLNFGFGYLLVFGAERKHVGDMISKSIVIKVDR